MDGWEEASEVSSNEREIRKMIGSDDYLPGQHVLKHTINYLIINKYT